MKIHFIRSKAFFKRRSVQSNLSLEPDGQLVKNVNYTEKSYEREEGDKRHHSLPQNDAILDRFEFSKQLACGRMPEIPMYFGRHMDPCLVPGE